MITIDKTLDARGLAGPRTSTLTMHILENMHDGQVLRLITDDMRSRQSIPLMCETCGYHLLNRTEDAGVLSFIIQKHGTPNMQGEG